MMIALFSLFIIEMVLNHKMAGQAHSHGGNFGTAINNPELHNHGHSDNASVPERPPRYGHNSFEADEVAFEKRVQQQIYVEQERRDAAYRMQGQVDAPDAQDLQNRSEMPAWFVVFYEQYVRQRLELMNMIRPTQPALAATGTAHDVEKSGATVSATDSAFLDDFGNMVDPLVYKKLSMNITLLEGGILFHSVFVGMTVSITIEGFVILLVAILFHQTFEGLGLGSRIAAVPYPKGSIRPWILVAAFGMTAPIGQAIGLMVRNSYDPNSAFGLIIVGIFNAISSGLLLYASTVDLLAEDFLSEEANRELTKKDKIAAFSYVLLGAIGMSIVGAFA